MKILTVAVAAALSTLVVPVPLSEAAKEINGVAAIVNGRVITKSEVRVQVAAQRQMLQTVYRSEPLLLKEKLAELETNALDAIIDRELILSDFKETYAKRAKVSPDDIEVTDIVKPQYIDDLIKRVIRERFDNDRERFIKELAKTGQSITEFRKQQAEMTLVMQLRHQKSGTIPPVAPAEVDAEYRSRREELRDKSEDKVNLHTITIPAYSGDNTKEQQRKLAEDMRKKLVAGADFATTARTYSQDSKAEAGGAWGWVDRTHLNEVLAKNAFSIPVKTVGPVVEDGAFFRILYVEARALSEPKPLSEVRTQIERLVEQKKSKEIQDRWLALLRKGAVIRRF